MMSALQTLGRMLGVRSDLAEDAMHSERAAKAVLSRRNLFAAAGAMAAGAVFVPVSAPFLAHEFVGGFSIQISFDIGDAINGWNVTTWIHGIDRGQSITLSVKP